jgi:hypothetical protein
VKGRIRIRIKVKSRIRIRKAGLTPTSKNQAEIALKSEGFTDIDFATLEMILGRETLNCKEIVVFEVSNIDESVQFNPLWKNIDLVRLSI